MDKTEPPGLTFYVTSKQLGPPAVEDHKAVGVINLNAVVTDLSVWDAVVDKLDGMVIHTVNDVAGTLVDVAKRRAERAEKQAMSITEESRQEVDRLNADISFKDQEILSLQGQLAQVVQERDMALEGLRAHEEYMKFQGCSLPEILR
jgi:hypothetical protein